MQLTTDQIKSLEQVNRDLYIEYQHRVTAAERGRVTYRLWLLALLVGYEEKVEIVDKTGEVGERIENV